MFGNQLSVLFDRSRAQRFAPHQTLRQITTECEESDDLKPEVVVITDSEDETHTEAIRQDNRKDRCPSVRNNQTATTTRSNDAVVGQPDSAKEMNDIVSTAWLQERLARADAEKKRTVFLPGPPLPVPREKRPLPREKLPLPREKPQKPCVPFRGVGGGSFHVPIRVSKETKQNDLDVNRVSEAGIALSRYIEKDPGNERTLQEYEEYTTCKEKLDRGETLVTAERDRMRSIKRNAERREYSFQRKRPSQKIPTASRAKKQKVEAKKEKVEAKSTKTSTTTNSKKADTREVEDYKRIEELERTIQAFSNPTEASTEAGSSQALDCSPTSKKSIGPGIGPYGKEEWDDSPQSDEYAISRNRVAQEPRKTVAGKGLIKEIVEQTQDEEPPEPMVSDESSSEEEDGEIEEQESFWQYDVYRREITDPDGNCDPILIGTYLDRRRAEEVVRSEISNIQASLQELCEFELFCKFEQNGIREQALIFPCGRSVEVFIEKDVVPEDAGNCKRPKKARLPTKLYIVMEETMETEPADGIFEAERAVETKRTVHKESYIFWQDANKQANKLFVARQTARFEEDERFDIGITGSIDTDGRRYLHELEAGERLFDKTTEVMPVGKDGKSFKAHIWVQEQLLRGPRN